MAMSNNQMVVAVCYNPRCPVLPDVFWIISLYDFRKKKTLHIKMRNCRYLQLTLHSRYIDLKNIVATFQLSKFLKFSTDMLGLPQY